MCGIAALFSPDSRPLSELIRNMTETVRHRGPDDEGFAIFSLRELAPMTLGGRATPAAVYTADIPYAPRRYDGSIPHAAAALGHRRLSIIDLGPSGHQPMCTSDRQLWIVYNGEIYNYLELREELKVLGHSFVSNGDAEVILAAYREWGDNCLARFNGMFAFVLVDRAQKKILAARDRFGVKPLYYWRSREGLLAFASEIKQFTVLPGWRACLNGQRAYEFLNWGLLDHTAETLFTGVRQLRGGESIHCSLENLMAGPPIKRWYGLTPRLCDKNMKAAGDELCALFTDAVRLRLRADVQVGSCLSGGLDSSSIVCVVNQMLRLAGMVSKQNTFSACAKVKRYDERDFIDIVVAHTGARAHYTYPDVTELFEMIDAITWHQDEPFGSTSIFAQWEVFRLAANKGVRVMLDGQGADELLAGYHNYFAPRFVSLLRSCQWARLWQEMREMKGLHQYSMLWTLQQTLNSVLPEFLRQPLRRLTGYTGIATPWLDMEKLS
ncbi:MAG: asparagine synthase (glutamine-hydrolyzing), partial [Chloroflexi bacterium]